MRGWEAGGGLRRGTAVWCIRRRGLWWC